MGQCLESAQPNTQWETGEGKAGAQSNKVSKIFVALDPTVGPCGGGLYGKRKDHGIVNRGEGRSH